MIFSDFLDIRKVKKGDCAGIIGKKVILQKKREDFWRKKRYMISYLLYFIYMLMSQKETENHINIPLESLNIHNSKNILPE